MEVGTESTRTLRSSIARSLPDIMTGRRTRYGAACDMCGARTLTQTAPPTPCVVASLCGCVLLQCTI
eukprot:3617326-Prymnesium_polylepis.1